MKGLFKKLEGDKAIWAVVIFMGIISFSPVYSASTNLVYGINSGTPFTYLFKHFILLFLGFLIIYGVHKIPYRYFSGSSLIAYPFFVLLLIITLMQGTTISGANASRWLQMPFIGYGLQTSVFASLVLMVYVARYFSRNQNNEFTFKSSFIKLWIPVGVMLILILPANFSTTAILFSMVLLVALIGGYPIKYIASILGIALVSLALFVLVAKAFPDSFSNRVDTWINRVENFSNGNAEELYQVEKAKIAIATGGIEGRGPGKSVQKNFLPQSISDFIFAIIVEEHGLIGALIVIFCYLFLFIRILIAVKNAESVFGSLVVISVGLPIIFQAVINMAVAVNLFPVTGQTLPLISSGGTSIWATCIAIGIILSVTANKKKKETTNENENPLEILHEAID